MDFKPFDQMAAVSRRDGWHADELAAMQHTTMCLVSEAIADSRSEAPIVLDVRANGEHFLRLVEVEDSFAIERLSTKARFDAQQNRQIPVCVYWQTTDIFSSRQHADAELEKRSPSQKLSDVLEKWGSVRKEQLEPDPVYAWIDAFSTPFDMLHFWLDILDAERHEHNVARYFGASAQLACSLVEMPYRPVLEHAQFARALEKLMQTIILGQQALNMHWAFR